MNINKAQDQTEAPLDRQAYLKEVRQEILINLGLPPNTKPQQVALLLEIKRKMDEINKVS